MRSFLTTLSAVLFACAKGDLKQAPQDLPHHETAVARPLATSRPLGELRIPHIEAHLIFAGGELSDDIIGAHHWTLWNTIIGEGDATDRKTGVHHPSKATLVRVVVAGPTNRILGGVKVELLVEGLGPSETVMEGAVAHFDSTGMQFVPFLLDGTGCSRIRLTARLITDRP